MEDRDETTDIQPAEQMTPNVRALIFGTPNFTPTQLMTQTLHDYLLDEEGLTPQAILRKNGRADDNWWIWPKRHPGFLDWWNGIIEHYFAKHRLNDLYKALHKRGVTHDTQAAKIVIQRFDPRFTERSQADIRGVFAGYEPSEAEDSRERQRKALAKPVDSLPVVQGEEDDQPLLSDNGGMPANRTHATARDQTGDSKPISGGCQVYGVSTPAIQAQSHDGQHEPGMDEQASDDKTLDFEPITKVDPPGGGFEE